MKYYVVIDTNVLVSALMKPESIPGVILEEALSGRIMPLLNSEILDEYEEVLSRRKFKFDHRDIRVAIDGLVRRGCVYSRPQGCCILCSDHGKAK